MFNYWLLRFILETSTGDGVDDFNDNDDCVLMINFSNKHYMYLTYDQEVGLI